VEEEIFIVCNEVSEVGLYSVCAWTIVHSTDSEG